MTVRNAVDTLVNEGILRRVQGKGVFVVGDKYEENLDEHGGFVNVMSSGTKRVSIKEQAKIYRPAGNKYANYFNIEPDDLIFCVRHQITLDSEPLAIEDIYVPKDVLPKLEVVNSSVFTIKDIFAFYGIEISSMQQTMEIIDGTSKIKKLLDIPNGVALIMLSCSSRIKRIINILIFFICFMVFFIRMIGFSRFNEICKFVERFKA